MWNLTTSGTKCSKWFVRHTLILTLILLPLSALAGWGVTLSKTGRAVHISYIEPPATHLQYTTIWYHVPNQPPQATDIAASRPTGEGTISTFILIRDLPRTLRVPVSFWVTATDSYDQESPPSEVVIIKLP